MINRNIQFIEKIAKIRIQGIIREIAVDIAGFGFTDNRDKMIDFVKVFIEDAEITLLAVYDALLLLESSFEWMMYTYIIRSIC